MSQHESFDVVIVGAGVGGAASALAFAQDHQLRVLVLEQHKGPGNLNRGDSLLPTVTAYLHSWGVLGTMRRAGARELASMQVFARQGLLMEVPLAPPGTAHPYLVLAHPEIERSLIAAACATGRVEVRYRSRVVGLSDHEGRVAGVRLRGSDGEQEINARLVVGADGYSSKTRAALGIKLRKRPYRHSYYGTSLSRPPSYQDAMRLELSRRGGVLVVPRIEPDRVGVGVLVHPDEEPTFRTGSPQQKLAALQRRSRLFDGCQLHPEGSHLYRLFHGHARRYVAPGAALLGDAVHVTNPVAGQGMTMAIEDAAALARLTAPALVGGACGPRLDRALRRYQAERRPLNARLLLWSHWLSHIYTWPGALANWLRTRVFALGASRFGRRVQRTIYKRLAQRERPA